MSKKMTSTAALDSLRHGPLSNQRRVPRHPAGARRTNAERSKQGNSQRYREVQQARFVIHPEEVMKANTRQRTPRKITTILAVILRITFSLLLWTLGVATMNLAAAQNQPKEHRVVQTFPVDRATVENLQRWVNAGHDTWCRDPQLVAAAALRRVSPEFSDYEPSSLPLELEHSRKTKAIYTFHSLDGRTTYRITLRRYPYLLPTAGSLHKMIWVPESAEIITREIQNKPITSSFPQNNKQI
jgi:hypothetical protein